MHNRSKVILAFSFAAALAMGLGVQTAVTISYLDSNASAIALSGIFTKGTGRVLGDATTMLIPAQPTFNYNPGYPKNCSNVDPGLYPANDYPVCAIPSMMPLGSYPVPAVGQSYVDQNFGTTVKVLTPAVSIHGYGSPTAFSASGKYAALAVAGEQADVVDTATGQIVRHMGKGVVSSNTVRWDATNDAIYYYTDAAKVQKYNWQTDTVTTVIDYAKTSYGFSNLDYGATGDLSKDNWLPFDDYSTHMVCVLNLNDPNPLNGTYCADYNTSQVTGALPPLSAQNIDSVLISKGVDAVTHKRYVIMMADPAMAFFSVDTINHKLNFEFRGPEWPAEAQASNGNGNNVCDPGESCLKSTHADTYEDSDGQQYIFSGFDSQADAAQTTKCARNVASFRISAGINMLKDAAKGGGRTIDMTVNYCIGYDPAHEQFYGEHFACAKQSPICAFEVYDGAGNVRDVTKAGDLTAPFFPGAHYSEIIIMSGNGKIIRPIAIHRSVIFSTDNYWYTPRVSLSNDGTKAIWDSNFGYVGDQNKSQNHEWVVEADTGISQSSSVPPPINPTPAPTPVPTVVIIITPVPTVIVPPIVTPKPTAVPIPTTISLPPLNQTPRVGSLIVVNGLTVYLVGSNGLYGFPSLAVFQSWGYTASNIISPNNAEQNLKMIGLVPAKFSACSNPLDQISGACAQSTVKPRVGQLVVIDSSSSKTVYLVGDNGLYGFPSLSVFNSWHYTFSQITSANSAETGLQMVGLVPAKQASCAAVLSQIAGSCGTH